MIHPVKFDQLIDSIPGQIDKVLADGAYGTVTAYKKCDERDIELVAKPKRSDVVGVPCVKPILF